MSLLNLKKFHDYYIIKNSGLFNEEWFKREYDLNPKKPIMYYLNNYKKSSLNPSPDFDTQWYLDQYPDVRQSGQNPFVHYIKHGITEHRLPKSLIEENNDKFSIINTDYYPCFFKNYSDFKMEYKHCSDTKNDFNNFNGSVNIAVFIKSENENFIPTDYIRIFIPFYHLFLKNNITPYLFNKSDIEDIKNNPIFNDEKLFDIFIVQRDAVDLEMAEFLVKICQNNGSKLVYETDDDLLNIDENHPDYDEFSKNIKSIEYLLCNCDAVTVSTNSLKNKLSQYNENIYVIKNSLNDCLLNCLKSNDNKSDSNNIKIGYMGTLTHKNDLKLIEPAIKNIKNKHKNVQFEIVGISDEELDYCKRINVPWNYQKYPYFIKWLSYVLDWDIAVAPLLYNEINRSKSEIKYLEYSSLAIPGIYSDVGAYNEAIDDGINGILVRNPDEWESSILALIEDKKLREKIVRNSREDIKKEYSLESMVSLWTDLIDDLLNEDKREIFNQKNNHPLLVNKEFVNDFKVILNSNTFDYAYYCSNNDLNSEKNDSILINPIYHYLSIGVFEGFNPNNDFDSLNYAKLNNLDIENTNPFVHYIHNYENRFRFKLNESNIKDIDNSQDREVSIIIPIYNAYEDVKACIESVLRNSTGKYELILINDASTDKRIGELLKEYEENSNIKIIHNKKNLGFVSTVNIGLKESENDVILLNSDTVVTAKWMEKLITAAYSNEKIATVTPLSNNAGAFSTPIIARENIIPDGLTIDSMANIVEKVSNHVYIRVPTGNGYCMYIKRTAIDDVGCFDDETFKRGYGEENDFCMRLKEKGWEHIIDDSTYIFHKGSSSFSDERNELLIEHTEILKKKYPSYESEVNEFINSDVLKEIHSNIQYGIDSYGIENFDKKRELSLVDSDFNDIYDKISENEIFVLNTNDNCLYKIIDNDFLKIKKLDYLSVKELCIQLAIDTVHFEFLNKKE